MTTADTTPAGRANTLVVATADAVHVRSACTADHGATPRHCGACDGGLFVCAVCGAGEGELTTHCPGQRVSATRRQDVYDGLCDFVNGEWRHQAAWPAAALRSTPAPRRGAAARPEGRTSEQGAPVAYRSRTARAASNSSS